MKWKLKKNEKGFTLIEMLVVLLVISVLLIITIPNITKHQSNIQTKGCDAFVKMVQAQVQAYEMDNNRLPANVGELKSEGYLKQTSCPNGDNINLDADGVVTVVVGTP
ncbi:competence type IV pilus major pilin ComGC [Bacillus sp. V59.32b]|uniref:competence type IV pilus major pilin ComGC n=1 Tax=Bacillus sp. V59.32b TaxID=1758642 RepID=UPI000E3B8770|nr:competence type IV pilus major pilin ComGC [Bacillus sp. V59.32b]RFU61952.1 prepilin-type N-terminal cleavage/methylation domain-containing protein [Bacillus sp. V59.32b]